MTRVDIALYESLQYVHYFLHPCFHLMPSVVNRRPDLCPYWVTCTRTWSRRHWGNERAKCALFFVKGLVLSHLISTFKCWIGIWHLCVLVVEGIAWHKENYSPPTQVFRSLWSRSKTSLKIWAERNFQALLARKGKGRVIRLTAWNGGTSLRRAQGATLRQVSWGQYMSNSRLKKRSSVSRRDKKREIGRLLSWSLDQKERGGCGSERNRHRHQPGPGGGEAVETVACTGWMCAWQVGLVECGAKGVVLLAVFPLSRDHANWWHSAFFSLKSQVALVFGLFKPPRVLSWCRGKKSVGPSQNKILELVLIIFGEIRDRIIFASQCYEHFKLIPLYKLVLRHHEIVIFLMCES
jgi:hypothetical protein